jgi:hypothetical protein
MIIDIKAQNSYSLVSILGNNGNPADGKNNPVDEATELPLLEFPEANGKLAIISGMPMTAVAAVATAYKNSFQAIAVANPRLGVAFVVHSTTPAHPMGSSVPLG